MDEENGLVVFLLSNHSASVICHESYTSRLEVLIINKQLSHSNHRPSTASSRIGAVFLTLNILLPISTTMQSWL